MTVNEAKKCEKNNKYQIRHEHKIESYFFLMCVPLCGFDTSSVFDVYHFYTLLYVLDLINGKKICPFVHWHRWYCLPLHLIVSFCYCLQLLLAKPKWNQSLRVKCVHRNRLPKSYTQLLLLIIFQFALLKGYKGRRSKKEKPQDAAHKKKEKEWNECVQFYVVQINLKLYAISKRQTLITTKINPFS